MPALFIHGGGFFVLLIAKNYTCGILVCTGRYRIKAITLSTPLSSFDIYGT
jgi:hypothetical protein